MPETTLFKLFDPVYYMWLVNVLGSFVCCLKFWFSFRLVVLLLCYENDPSFVIQSSQIHVRKIVNTSGNQKDKLMNYNVNVQIVGRWLIDSLCDRWCWHSRTDLIINHMLRNISTIMDIKLQIYTSKHSIMQYQNPNMSYCIDSQ